ncbi:MAG TPA: VWA domain-containing protein [Ilumatobacteraceae bacterium]|nr:VWA domain-containing protein [Ilumatobacteraceae bacterium]
MVDLATVAATFGDRLHSAGIPVTPERSGRFAAVMDLTAPATYDDVYWAARITLISGHDQLEQFDRVFGHVFGELADQAGTRGDPGSPPAGKPRLRSAESSENRRGTAGSGRSGEDHRHGDDEVTAETLAMTSSGDEYLHQADYAALTPSELMGLRKLMTEMRLAPPTRTRRRTQRSSRGQRLDLRATIRRSRRTAGDPVERIRRRQTVRPRRLVMLADVSGSMEPYARAYLQLLHCAAGGAHAETFVFATRLTRLTRQLRIRNANVALQRAAASAPDWAGGTRLGDAMKAFNDGWGRRGMARGAVVLIVSDGWDSGDPGVVAEQMARLSRLAHHVVWVNPRKQSQSYQPLVGAMSAALPYVDSFVSGHSLDAMHDVLRAIGQPLP